MPQSTALPPRAAALLLGLVAALLLFRLGAVPLVGPDEPRYARVAIEMHRAHEWVRPTLTGEPWLEKPPLYYWLAGIGFSLFGETETAARLPSVAAALLMVGATALVGARLYGSAAGLHAGFILGTSLLPFAYGRAASMDMLLAATVTAVIGLAGLSLLGVAAGLAVPAAGLFVGLAMLAKGPLGLLLPALVILGFAAVTRDSRFLRQLASPAALALCLLVAAPWYLAIYRDQGRAFIDVFLLGHNLQRFTSTIHHHPGPFFYYLPVIVAGLFPWSGLTLPAFAGLEPRKSRTDLFVLVWLLLPLAFFSSAGSKLPGYILPCLPPLALLMGRAADALTSDAIGYGWKRMAALVGLALAAAVAAGPYVLSRMGEPAWRATIPVGLWAVAVAYAFSRRILADAAGALALLRVGAGGFLVLLAIAAPDVIAHQQSGRELFRETRGEPVLAFGAWRTAWMAGYFYNDGNVAEVRELSEIAQKARAGPVLVLCGPKERRQIEAAPDLTAVVLAYGPKGNALLRVAARAGPS
jgi:4-amino-4-deoxy-L-arabinose transferase-like glycosyltransferase